MTTETAAEQARKMIHQHAQELRGSWQARLLAEAEGREYAVAQCIIALEWPSAIGVLMSVVFPGFIDIQRPFLMGYAATQIDGSVWCMIVTRDYSREYAKIYDHEPELTAAFRGIADKLKLNDEDRKMLFDTLRRWVTSDARVDPYGSRRKMH